MAALVWADLRSNPVSDGTITIDSNRDDWEGLTPYPTDPEEDDVLVDFATFTLAHDSTYLYVRYTTRTAPVERFRYNLFLDTDSNRNSGYFGSAGQFSIGAELLLQGSSLYQFTGINQSDWSWNCIASADSNVTSNDFELRFQLSFLGGIEQFNWIGHGDGWPDYEDDYVPDGGDLGENGNYHTYVIPEPRTVFSLLSASIVLSRISRLRRKRRRWFS